MPHTTEKVVNTTYGPVFVRSAWDSKHQKDSWVHAWDVGDTVVAAFFTEIYKAWEVTVNRFNSGVSVEQFTPHKSPYPTLTHAVDDWLDFVNRVYPREEDSSLVKNLLRMGRKDTPWF